MKSNPTTNYGGAMSPPDGGKFARCLGAFIMNCGVLEFHTYAWMVCLSPQFALPANASELSWAERVGWIRDTLKPANLSKSVRADVRKELAAIQKIYELRNIVAHNPMMWGRHEDGLLFAIIPNVKKSLGGKPSKIVEFEDIESAISTTEAVYRRMQDLLERVAADIGIEVPPCHDTFSFQAPPQN